MSYKTTDNPDIVVREDGMSIPRDHPLWEEFEEWVAAGGVPGVFTPYELYSPEHFQHIQSLAWAWMLSIVQRRRYDTIESCCSYATSSVPRYRQEAAAMVAWRDAINLALEQLVMAAPAGVETWEQVQAILPQPEAFDWPELNQLPIDPSQEAPSGTTDQPAD